MISSVIYLGKRWLCVLCFIAVYVNCLSVEVGLSSRSASTNSCFKNNSILFLPLDERFTTRTAFLNLAGVSSYCIVTPPLELLPQLKSTCDIDALHAWVDENLDNVDHAIISSEMYLYGGLITSRTSNETYVTIRSRLDKLSSYSLKYPNLQMYLSNVVMRIPAYNGDFEEPYYWAYYGYDLYSYSFYTDKYSKTGESSDYDNAMMYYNHVPPNIVEEFLWRRQRNHNITMDVLSIMNDSLSQSNPNSKDTISDRLPFVYVYITLDDNAEYGFNIREAQEIKDYVNNASLLQKSYAESESISLSLVYDLLLSVLSPSETQPEQRLQSQQAMARATKELPNKLKPIIMNPQYHLQSFLSERVPIYPGADEVQLVQLARLASTLTSSLASAKHVYSEQVTIGIVYRDPDTVDLIPNYEGQAMSLTLAQQIAAAGAQAVVLSANQTILPTEVNVVLFVNNFSEEKQMEAPYQPISSSSDLSDFQPFEKYMDFIIKYNEQIALAKSRNDVNIPKMIPIGFCDNRYSNGGDLQLVRYMQSKLSAGSVNYMYWMAYSGWNTNGNTIGTAVANLVLLALSARNPDEVSAINNAKFNSMRLLEDVYYQSVQRQDLISYVSSIDGTIDSSNSEESTLETINSLNVDLSFYTRYSYKRLDAYLRNITRTYHVDNVVSLASIYYPWNRTFEIGFTLN